MLFVVECVLVCVSDGVMVMMGVNWVVLKKCINVGVLSVVKVVVVV